MQKTISVMHVPDGIARRAATSEEADHPHIIKVREAQWDPEFKGVKAVTFVCPYYPGGSVLDAFRAGHVFSVEAVVGMASTFWTLWRTSTARSNTCTET